MGSDSAADWEAPKPAIVFISYSRSEAMLVDDLGERLEPYGYETWIDFEDLTPGDDWKHQLDAAIDGADVALLVVSRRSTQSKNVQFEWQRAKAAAIPMILVIAETVELEEPFAGLPWVDVRTDYTAAVQQLAGAIEGARLAAAAGRELPEPDTPAPTTGFRAPRSVWLAFLVSLPVAAASLLTFWTIILPVVLVPLPTRILRRSFNYTDVRNALIGLPVALVSMGIAIDRTDGGIHPVTGAAAWVAGFSGLATFLLVRSDSCRRWLKPSAARPRSAHAVVSDASHRPEPVRYRVDAVSEDRRYAEAVGERLAEFGHERVDTDDAERTLRFISQFHDVTEIDRSGETLPIVVSDPDDEIPPRLQRRQWIDLRRGAEPSRLEAIGRYLDDPKRMLQVIGSPPPHEQRLLPKGVQGLFVALWVSISAICGFGFLLVAGVRSELDAVGAERLALSGTFAVVVVAGMLWLTRTLRLRRPSRLRASLIPLLAIGSFVVIVPVSSGDDELALSAEATTGIENAFALIILPMALLIYFWLFHWAAIRMWIPSRSDDSSRDGSGRRGTA